MKHETAYISQVFQRRKIRDKIRENGHHALTTYCERKRLVILHHRNDFRKCLLPTTIRNLKLFFFTTGAQVIYEWRKKQFSEIRYLKNEIFYTFSPNNGDLCGSHKKKNRERQ